MRVLNLRAFDSILGYDWLALHSPMTCYWHNKTLEFLHNGQLVSLQGIVSSNHSVQSWSAQQLLKLYKGNDIWAFVLVSKDKEEQSSPPQPEIQTLLDEYKDVFSYPKTLPPSRPYDHTIPLIPGAVPVNSKPYRYSPQQKYEIERQVQEMLASGLIGSSTSPFASPVLLIQKKDGSCRFCVDFRRLNDLTIKNRFLMPIIEEILKELARSKYFTKLDMKSGYRQVRM